MEIITSEISVRQTHSRNTHQGVQHGKMTLGLVLIFTHKEFNVDCLIQGIYIQSSYRKLLDSFVNLRDIPS